MGPVLFVEYINEITEIPLNEDSHLILFADDMVLIHPLVDSESINKLQEDVQRISAHIFNLGLKLNLKKYKLQILRTSKLQDSQNPTLSLEK